MLDLSINLPLLTDAGAKSIGVESMSRLQQMVPQMVPSASTARLFIAAGFLFGMGWLGMSCYKMYSSSSVHHTVEHSSMPPPGAAKPA